jgi:transposase
MPRRVEVEVPKPKKRKRRSFTPEYKAEVVRLVKTGGKSIAQVAAELDLGETVVRAWVNRAEVDAGKHPEGEGPLTTDERDELRRLRRENKRLEMERDILKKRRPSSPRRAREVRVHPGGEGQLPGRDDVPAARGVAQRLLCLAAAPTVGAQQGDGPTRTCRRRRASDEPQDVRQPASSR